MPDEEQHMPDGEGEEIKDLAEEGAELTEEEMAAMPDEPSEETEPAEVEHDEIRDGA